MSTHAGPTAPQVGERVGMLVVMSVDRIVAGQRRATVRCDCGTVKTVARQALRAGTVSCGCKKAADSANRLRELRLKHGRSKGDRTYNTWCSIKQRCLDPNFLQFHYWGGRGITICERWRDNFDAFLADMGERPVGTTIDRIDNDGHYTPGNCRWATPLEQSRNRRNVRALTAQVA